MAVATPAVRVEATNGVANLVLASGETGNAMTLENAQAFKGAVDQIGHMPRVRCLVIRAEGPRFCVGGDLRAFVEAPAGRRLHDEVARVLHSAISSLGELPMPVLCAVQGAVAGGGVGIVLAADIAIAAKSASFTAGYTASGLSPDCAVSWELPRRVGLTKAMDLILTNRRVVAIEAAELGIVARVVDDEALASETDGLARGLANGPRAALAEAKRLVRASTSSTREAQMDDEARTIGDLGESRDGKEGMSAFLEKRQPMFDEQAIADS